VKVARFFHSPGGKTKKPSCEARLGNEIFETTLGLLTDVTVRKKWFRQSLPLLLLEQYVLEELIKIVSFDISTLTGRR